MRLDMQASAGVARLGWGGKEGTIVICAALSLLLETSGVDVKYQGAPQTVAAFGVLFTWGRRQWRQVRLSLGVKRAASGEASLHTLPHAVVIAKHSNAFHLKVRQASTPLCTSSHLALYQQVIMAAFNGKRSLFLSHCDLQRTTDGGVNSGCQAPGQALRCRT